MRISDWSSDVCSSDLGRARARRAEGVLLRLFKIVHRDAEIAEIGLALLVPRFRQAVAARPQRPVHARAKPPPAAVEAVVLGVEIIARSAVDEKALARHRKVIAREDGRRDPKVAALAPGRDPKIGRA